MRIRSLKPDYMTDRVTGRWPLDRQMFYAALWCYADDQGRFEWEPDRIRGALFPYKPGLDVDEYLRWLVSTGKVQAYEVDGVWFGVVVSLTKHQKPNRPIESKLPPPPCVLTEDAVRTQCVLPPVVVVGVVGGEGEGGEEEASSEASSEPPSRQQSTGSTTGVLAFERVETATPSLLPDVPDGSPVVAVLPCVGNGPRDFLVTAKMCAAWTQAYPAVDVMAEVGRAVQWCVDNPNRRKTAKGARSFLGRWMAKQQDSGRANAFTQAPRRGPGECPKPGDPNFNDPTAWPSWGQWNERDSRGAN